MTNWEEEQIKKILIAVEELKQLEEVKDYIEKTVLLINNRKLLSEYLDEKVSSVDEFIKAKNNPEEQIERRYLLGVPVLIIDEIQRCIQEGKIIKEMCQNLVEPIEDPKMKYREDEIKEKVKSNLINSIRYEGDNEEKLKRKYILQRYINNPYLYRLLLFPALLTMGMINNKLNYKYLFSRNVENAIKKIIEGKGTLLTNNEKNTLRLVAYSSEYLPNAEGASVLKEDFDEATLMITMKKANNSIFKKKDVSRKDDLDIPFVNEKLFSTWEKKYIKRKEEILKKDTENVLQGEISVVENIDMLRGIRNAIAHGGFVYELDSETLHLNSEIGLEDGKGYMEISLSSECIFDLCDNYFKDVNKSTVLNALNTNFNESSPLDMSEIFRYYINSIFAYNGWILSENACKVRDAEPLKSTLEKFCGAFIDKTTGEKFIYNQNENENENDSHRNDRIIRLLNKIRNSTVHSRTYVEGENICIKIPEETDKNGNLVKAATVVYISEESFKNVVKELNITDAIEETIDKTIFPNYKKLYSILENLRMVKERKKEDDGSKTER